MSLEAIITAYGYPAVLVATLFEGETALVIAGFLVRRGYLLLPWVMVIAFIGAFAGDQMYFLIGRKKGRAFLVRRPQWQARVQRIEGALERYQTVVMLGFRFAYGFRIATPFVIGMMGLSARRFLVLNAIGAAVWAVVVSSAGYLFGSAVETLLGDIKKYEVGVILFIVAVAAVMFVFHRVKMRRVDSQSLEC